MFSCNKCGDTNDYKIKDTLDGHTIMEAETVCTKCGYKDYWAYGYFASMSEGYNSCVKYYN